MLRITLPQNSSQKHQNFAHQDIKQILSGKQYAVWQAEHFSEVQYRGVHCSNVRRSFRPRQTGGRSLFSPRGRGRKTTCILLSNSSNLGFTMKCNSWDCVLVPTLDSLSDSDGLFFTEGGDKGGTTCLLSSCHNLAI